MNRRPKFAALALLVLFAASAGCRTAADLIYEPEATDPLDGYQGSLAQAGINTEMDWGPKQNLLLGEFKALKEAHSKLDQRLQQVLAENQNLKAQLAGESQALQKEKGMRAQAEAETELLRQRRRELEARVLSLSIEKARLEQANLASKIGELQRAMQEMEPGAVEAAATPPRAR